MLLLYVAYVGSSWPYIQTKYEDSEFVHYLLTLTGLIHSARPTRHSDELDAHGSHIFDYATLSTNILLILYFKETVCVLMNPKWSIQ